MMRDLREKTKIIMIVVALAFVGLMVFEWGMDISGTSVAQQTGEVARVNGEPVSMQTYTAAYQALYEQARAQMGGEQLTRDQIRQVEEQAFNEVVNELLMMQELERRKIRVSNREVMQAAQWLPHPDLMNNELFMTDGAFDISKYQQFITGPSANEQLLMQLESFYRASIPRSKLMRQVTAGLYVGDTELWQAWRDQSETATVEYVQLSPSILVPGDVEVTDREIRSRYDEDSEEFQRPATARVTIASIAKAPTATDTIAALSRIQALREEILVGGDFAAIAERESEDTQSAAAGGDLGFFGRDEMTASFDQAAFSLPIGELSEPVATPFGFHLIEVQERNEDQARARHILIPYEPSDEALDRLYTRADSLELLVERTEVDRAARIVDATLQEGVVISSEQAFVPGIGSALEAVEWIEAEQLEPEPFNISPLFETPEAFYLVSIEAYRPAGAIPLDEATPEIRRQLILAKKSEQARRIGQEMVAEIRGGKAFEQVATERGLTMETAGPFTRLGANPAFGQANAVTGAAFGLPINQVSDVLTTPGGLFIIRPIERTEADREQFEAEKDQLREFMLYQLQQEALARWMDGLRREANIVDRRT